MFDLEKSIVEWRKQMLAAGVKSPVPMEELESHLREHVETKMRLGLDARQAFAGAAQETGRPDMIKNEFKKVGSGNCVAEWLMIGVCATFVCLILFLGGATVVMCFTGLADRAMAATAMASSVLVAFCWRYAVPFLPVIASTWKRTAAGLACIVTGIVAGSLYCNYVLPHFQTGGDQIIPAIAFWAIFLISIFACAGVGLCLNEKDRERLGMGRS